MRIAALAIAAAATALTLTACGPTTITSTTPIATPAPIAASAPTEAPAAPLVAATTVAAPVQLTIPDVIGKNGQIAADQLKKAGFKHVSYASGTPGVKMVILASNWTVTSVEPGVGTPAEADDTIVLTMVKING